MRLIGLAVILAIGLIAAPLAADAQDAKKMPRVGVLLAQSPAAGRPTDALLREGLRKLGYIEGQNIAIEWRYARGKTEQFPDLAAELVRLKVDVIVAPINPAIAAAQSATSTIPIVMVLASDPVGHGFVASLPRPGRNITGLASQNIELHAKLLELLKEVVPNLSRVAVLWDPSEPGRRGEAQAAELGTRTLAMLPQLFEARSPSELDNAFEAMTRNGMDAVFVTPSAMIAAHQTRIAGLAVKGHLPTMCVSRSYIEAGCLMSYSADIRNLFQRAAYFVDRILKGAKPADLPVEQPTKFVLVINLKTAKVLGLTIPQTLLQRADQVIQ
jgi:putative tryptophan/tyrosine transport system substrate-binding protein